MSNQPIMSGFIKHCALFAIIALLPSGSAVAATKPPVSLELSIPPAATYVIGDGIKLHWKFRNHTTDDLTFMWEGCCRVNGRVDMKRLGAPVASPTGIRPSHVGFGPGIYNASCQHCRMERQKTELTVAAATQTPATAHMFARPARLAANGTQEFETALANWVLLEATGDYKLSGGYLGVHPKQRPMMPRGAKLWDGITSSPAIELSLLTVTAYLSEREARQQARDLKLELSSPKRAKPRSRTRLASRITNTSGKPQVIIWASEASLWVVDTEGRRLPDSRHAINDRGNPITIGPAESATAVLHLAEDFFTGKPFGEYQVFVELKAGTDSIRVPSAPVTIHWKLEAGDIRELLLQAADQPEVGHRNPPLKLMRLHLAEIGSALDAIDINSLPEKARPLTRDLQTASRLKPMQVRPGTATLNLRIAADGSAAFQSPFIRKALGNKDALAQLADVIRLRRHLGWMLTINLRIDRAAKLSSVATWISGLSAYRKQLTKAPRTRAFNATATAFSEITFAANSDSASPNALRADARLTWGDFLKSAAGKIDKGTAFELVILP